MEPSSTERGGFHPLSTIPDPDNKVWYKQWPILPFVAISLLLLTFANILFAIPAFILSVWILVHHLQEFKQKNLPLDGTVVFGYVFLVVLSGAVFITD